MSKSNTQNFDIGIFGNAVESQILAHTIHNHEPKNSSILIISETQIPQYPIFYFSEEQSLFTAAADHVWKRISVYSKRLHKSALLMNSAWYLTYSQDLIKLLQTHQDHSKVTLIPSGSEQIINNSNELQVKYNQNIYSTQKTIDTSRSHFATKRVDAQELLFTIKTSHAKFDSTTLILNDTRTLPIGWSIFFAPVSSTDAFCKLNPPYNNSFDESQLRFLIQQYVSEIYDLHLPTYTLESQRYSPFMREIESDTQHESTMNSLAPANGWLVHHNWFGLGRLEKQFVRIIEGLETSHSKRTVSKTHQRKLFKRSSRKVLKRFIDYLLFNENVDVRNKLFYFLPIKWVSKLL